VEVHFRRRMLKDEGIWSYLLFTWRNFEGLIHFLYYCYRSIIALLGQCCVRRDLDAKFGKLLVAVNDVTKTGFQHGSYSLTERYA
jgi:hypothetical protein